MIAIGGNYTDWYGAAAGGVAYVGGFYNSAPNVGYVFPGALANGNPKYVAEAAAHEAGHLFGLQHQAAWSGKMALMAEQALASGSPNNNPRVPNASEIVALYRAVWTDAAVNI